MTFCTDGRFWVYHNSDPIKPMVKSKQTKQMLNDKPSTGIIMGLGRLALGWDLANNRFLVKLNNIPHEELRPFVKDVRICRQKVVNTAEGNVR